MWRYPLNRVSVRVSQVRHPKAALSSRRSYPVRGVGQSGETLSTSLSNREHTQPETVEVWGRVQMVLFQCTFSTAPGAGHERELLHEHGGQDLIYKELQLPCVMEVLYLQGDREKLSDHLRPSPANGDSHQGQAK